MERMGASFEGNFLGTIQLSYPKDGKDNITGNGSFGNHSFLLLHITMLMRQVMSHDEKILSELEWSFPPFRENKPLGKALAISSFLRALLSEFFLIRQGRVVRRGMILYSSLRFVSGACDVYGMNIGWFR